MFELLDPTTVTLTNAQSRVEKHGDEDVMAIDLAVTWNTNNRSLTAIHKQLRDMLFCDMRQGSGDAQEEMDLPVDELPNVRVPGADYPIKLDFQAVGARVEVAYGISEKTAIVLQLCKVHKVRVTPIEGGSAEVKFAVSSASEIDDHIIGTLSVLQQREISLKLSMPDIEPAKTLTEGDVFKTVVPDEQQKQLSAEDVFVNSSAPADAPAPAKATRKGKKG
ncbi:hypothetical protein [Variovorax ginsengisoli]|uniref:DUF2589 domain-containing protein n=1 Tax=Variovorax ginsengisoli TaxID=363844 RepID=A0ABT8SF42_9BURK|nr:hypothetical protein [Variovorax ginsengisoli]MDN8617818.1 hypothetical protein [Variovorax ginsengisoli]MDO1536988.1 hypothetical protein [Variovorax ginsengisoli]